MYPFGGINTTTLLQHADIAMYSAKEKGNNVVCMYDETLSQKVTRRLRLEQDLPNAIENNELFYCINHKLIVRQVRLLVQRL